jgi:hypothetical protein
VEDTTGKGARGPLPNEAVEVEYLVGSLDAERAGGAAWTVDEFNDYAALAASNSRRDTPRRLSDQDLTRVKARRDELFAEWFATPPGGTLELSYEFVQC